MDIVWIVLVVAAMGGMWLLAYRMEPHWSSKDGRRFLCMAQELDHDQPYGRPRETRVMVMGDGQLHISQKRAMRRKHSSWTLIGKSPIPNKKNQTYVAELREDGQKVGTHLALRIPLSSKCTPVLDGILDDAKVRASRSGRENAAPADPPDPG